MKPLVYLAGPYSHDDPVANTHRTIQVADELAAGGRCIPYVPHLTLAWHLVSPKPYGFWIDYDLQVLRRCDAVLRLPGISAGADGEVAEAGRLGMLVAYGIDELYRLLWMVECREFGCEETHR